MREIRPGEIGPDLRNLFLLWEGDRPSPRVLWQIRACLRSIERFGADLRVYLFSNVIELESLSQFDFHLVRWERRELMDATPLEGRTELGRRAAWVQWSDLFRVLCLYRWGGTYFDVDDIMVREIGTGRNTLALCVLEGEHTLRWRRFGDVLQTKDLPGPVGLADPCDGLRVGADPLVRFDPLNRFIELWLTSLRDCNLQSSDWGQILPTRILAESPAWAWRHLEPRIWPDLLYHPYSGGHADCDHRYAGERIHCDSLVDRETALHRFAILKSHYQFFLVKNHLYNRHEHCGRKRPLLSWVITEVSGSEIR